MPPSVRTLLVVLMTGAGCVCGGPGGPDAAVPDAGAFDAGVDAGVSDAGPLDAGVVDAGVSDAGLRDAGGPDAGLPDAGGQDAGVDAGLPDAGRDGGVVDAGSSVTCAMLTCAPWQFCSEVAGVAACRGAVAISWASPVAGARAPIDLPEVPLAIDTTAAASVDVPWESSGVLASAGVFSGQPGLRAARLLLADVDGGFVLLSAGWPGGPIATTVLELTTPIVRLPAIPVHPATPDFEPNDPAGNAFRRDEVVSIEIGELPAPMALFARLDVPAAQTLALPVTQRCDAGSCWRVELDLKALDFPAFRGQVLIWVTGADGGVQSRPRRLPVTRWRWRRQISAVSSPLSLTRPVAGGDFEIAIGSVDTPTSGTLRHLSASGANLPLPSAFTSIPGAPTFAVTGSTPGLVAFVRDGGAVMEPDARPLESTPVTCSSAGGLSACVTTTGQMSTRVSLGGVRFGTFPTCATQPAALLMGREDSALVPEVGPICVARFAWPQVIGYAFAPTTGSYRSAFARDQQFALGMISAGADGGLFAIERVAGTVVETSLWDGGVVDGVAAITRRVQVTGPQSFWLYWATDDRRLHSAQYRLVGQRPQVITTEQRSIELLPERAITTPVVAQVLPSSGLAPAPGTVLIVGASGVVTAWDHDTLRPVWRLEAGDAGVRGGRVQSSSIAHTTCGRSGALLVPSAGDGSLYSFTLDGENFTWVAGDPWAMSGRSPENEQELPVQRCISW